MRKLLMGALALTTTLAFGTAAVGQVSTPAGDATLDVTATPSKAGKKKKPKNVKLRFKQDVNKPKTTVETITVDLPKGLAFSGKGFAKCTVETLAPPGPGPSGCPSGSQAGPTGSAAARLEPAIQGVSDLQFEVTPFVEDSNTFAIYLKTTDDSGLAIQTAIRGEVTSGGRKMTITIPTELRQPIPGVDATLTGIDQTFSGKRKKHYIVKSTGCKGKKWAVSGTLGFAQRIDGSVPPAPEKLTEKVKCKK